MNDENLIPLTKRTQREKKRIASMGGQASAKKKKERKTWREIANAMLSTKVNEHNQAILSKFGLEDADYNCYILYKLLEKAQTGDLGAITELKNITGNKEAENINLNGNVAITQKQKEIE